MIKCIFSARANFGCLNHSINFAACNLMRDAKTAQDQSLLKHIGRKIEFTGPITVHDYMRQVLTWPNQGFYMTQDVFGRKGHFTTSPEISQVFGELVAVWLLNEWRRFSCIKPLALIEFGPGRGTLMDDICRIISKFPEAKQNVHIHLVEVSPALKKVQHQTLGCDVSSQLSKYGFPVTWHGDLDEISSNGGFSIYLAHEFLDALPIHKFKRDADGNWREILIDCKRSGANSYQLNYVLSRHATPASKAFVPAQIESDQFEYCPDAMLLLNRLAKRLNQNPGLFLACDYGFSRQVDQLASISRDTFRSFKNHQQWDPLMEPGTADLTADVDFDAIKTLVQDKVTCFGPITQKQFLLCLGAHIRLVHLMKQTPDDQTRANLQSGVKMLLHDMGSKFKFFAMFPKSFSNLFENDPPAAFHEMKQ